jgi:hypothetical protein
MTPRTVTDVTPDVKQQLLSVAPGFIETRPTAAT